MSNDFNKNQAIQPTFKMVFPKFEELNFFCVEAELPGISMGGVEMPFKNNSTSVPSNRIEYDPISLQVLMDEDWRIHQSLHRWMRDIATGSTPVFDETVDSELHILDGSYGPVMGVKFTAVYPTQVGGLPLMIQNTDAMPVILTATFRYQFYDLILRK